MQPPSRGFPPIAAPDARLLVLGSLPGQVSLAHGSTTRSRRTHSGESWASCSARGRTSRTPSAPSACAQPHRIVGRVQGGVASRQPRFLDRPRDRRRRTISRDFFVITRRSGTCAPTAATARRLYLRRVRPGCLRAPVRLPLHLLPSTSPAHASLRFDAEARALAAARATAARSEPASCPAGGCARQRLSVRRGRFARDAHDFLGGLCEPDEAPVPRA